MQGHTESLATPRPPSPTHQLSDKEYESSQELSRESSATQLRENSEASSSDDLDQQKWQAHALGRSGGAVSGVEKSNVEGIPTSRRHGLRKLLRKRVLIPFAIALIMLIVLLSTLLTLLPGAAGVDDDPHESSDAPAVANGAVVDLEYGSYRGVDQGNGVSYWLGMRYAAPPVGQRRFAAPEPPERFEGIRDANEVVRGCAGVGPRTGDNIEDCLSIDVYSPANANNNSNLPVFLWIQGGGLNSATSHPNATGLIDASNNSLVVASITYRTGVFGFLASEELQANASLNNGLKDQRMAMQWVQNHIRNFGGDPDRVTVGGQSAGAGCIVSHLTAYGGNETDMFHAVLMQSASMPPIREVESSQFQFDNLVERVGCQDAPDRLQCLRDADYETVLRNALSDPFPDGAGGRPVFAYNTVIDDDMIREVPITAFEGGRFARVPMIFGDVTDEGTAFTNRDIATADDAHDFLENTFPRLNESSLARIADLYEFNGASGRQLWQRAAQAYGEIRYTCPGVQMSDIVTGQGHREVWNYRYNVDNPDEDFVAHGADLGPLWSNRNTASSRRSYYASTVPLLQGYWTSFIATSDPNRDRESGSSDWPMWSNGDGQRLRMESQGSALEGLTSDESERCDYLASISVWLEQ